MKFLRFNSITKHGLRIVVHAFSVIFIGLFQLKAESHLEADVCVYGGGAGVVAAALAAARRGADVVIAEPMRHLGGMDGGGIRLQRDCLYHKDIGGLAKELHDEDRRLPGDGQFANQWAGRLMVRRRVEEAGIRYFT